MFSEKKIHRQNEKKRTALNFLELRRVFDSQPGAIEQMFKKQNEPAIHSEMKKWLRKDPTNLSDFVKNSNFARETVAKFDKQEVLRKFLERENLKIRVGQRKHDDSFKDLPPISVPTVSRLNKFRSEKTDDWYQISDKIDFDFAENLVKSPMQTFTLSGIRGFEKQIYRHRLALAEIEVKIFRLTGDEKVKFEVSELKKEIKQAKKYFKTLDRYCDFYRDKIELENNLENCNGANVASKYLFPKFAAKSDAEVGTMLSDKNSERHQVRQNISNIFGTTTGNPPNVTHFKSILPS